MNVTDSSQKTPDHRNILIVMGEASEPKSVVDTDKQIPFTIEDGRIIHLHPHRYLTEKSATDAYTERTAADKEFCRVHDERVMREREEAEAMML